MTLGGGRKEKGNISEVGPRYAFWVLTESGVRGIVVVQTFQGHRCVMSCICLGPNPVTSETLRIKSVEVASV